MLRETVARRLQAFLVTAPWTVGLGIGRSILATATALTLALARPSLLFGPAQGVAPGPHCDGVSGFGPFCLLPLDLDVTRWCAVAVLVLVASGWCPRLTAIPHWWISWGLFSSATMVDGGEQVTAVLTLLLLPVALTDPRSSHWNAPRSGGELARLIGWSGRWAICAQVAVIYFQSAVSKLGVEQWVDGSALYYVMSDRVFGLPPSLEVLVPLLANSLVVAMLTWGTVLFELLLAIALLLPRAIRRPLLVSGIIFHSGIALLMELPSFGMAMMAALVLYLDPTQDAVAMPPAEQSTVPGRPNGSLTVSSEDRVDDFAAVANNRVQ